MIIYKITNRINGKVYIGQTVQKLTKRWADHCSMDRTRDGQSYLFNAVCKYGKENFIIEQIDSAQTLEGLNALEEMYIKKFDCRAPAGYNLLPGGLNKRHHESTKNKISQKLKGRPITNRWNGGNTTSPSEETRTKISQKLKGKSIKHRWTKGNTKPRTEEQKEYLRKLNKGTPNKSLYKQVKIIETSTVYESVNAAAKALDTNRVTVSKWCKEGKKAVFI